MTILHPPFHIRMPRTMIKDKALYLDKEAEENFNKMY